MSGQKIIAGLLEALNGNVTRLHMDGQTWVRADELAPLLDEIARLRTAYDAERIAHGLTLSALGKEVNKRPSLTQG